MEATGDDNEKEEEEDEHCLVGKDGSRANKWLQGNPGLLTTKCLGLSMGVHPVDTRDEMGRHLFHAFGLVRTVKGSVDKWYLDKHNRLNEVFGEVSTSLWFISFIGNIICVVLSVL